MACGAPEAVAPTLMNSLDDPDSTHCYFRRQPETADETAQAIDAVLVSCCGAVRYGGSNERVIGALRRGGSARACDELEATQHGGVEEQDRSPEPMEPAPNEFGLARWLKAVVRKISR